MKVGNARRARQDPEFQLKHRVTGAAIIAAAAALILALLLGEPGGGGGDAQTIRFDFGESGVAESNAAAQTAGDAEALSAALPDDAAAGESVDSVRNESVPPTAALDQSGWAVRVGAFSKQANIDAVTAELKKAGFQVNAGPVKGKALKSIWLGPYSDRKTAREARARVLATGLRVEPDVAEYTP